MSVYHNPRFQPAPPALGVRDLMPSKSPSEAVPESTLSGHSARNPNATIAPKLGGRTEAAGTPSGDNYGSWPVVIEARVVILFLRDCFPGKLRKENQKPLFPNNWNNVSTVIIDSPIALLRLGVVTWDIYLNLFPRVPVQLG